MRQVIDGILAGMTDIVRPASTDPLAIRKLKFARQRSWQLAKLHEDQLPIGITACAATTYAGVGLCQDLSQRFVLEYVLAQKRTNISLIFISKPGEHSATSHVFVYIGNLKVPDHLITGRGNSSVRVDLNSTFTVQELMLANTTGIYVDPLLECYGSDDRDERLRPLFDYIVRYGTTVVTGVRDYSNTTAFTPLAPEIQDKAKIIARQVIADSVATMDDSYEWLRVPVTPKNSRAIEDLKFVLNDRRGRFIKTEAIAGNQFAFFKRSWLDMVQKHHEKYGDDFREKFSSMLHLT